MWDLVATFTKERWLPIKSLHELTKKSVLKCVYRIASVIEPPCYIDLALAAAWEWLCFQKIF